MGQSLFKKYLLWHGQAHEHKFRCFYPMSAHNNRFKKKNMGQGLFKKYSKFQKI